MSIALAALSIALLGAGLTVRLRGGLRVAAALLLGLGSWSAAYAAALLLFGKGDRVLLAKDLVLAVAGALLVTLGGSPLEVRDPRPEAPAPGWLWISFAASCALATAAVVEHTLRFPDGGYDAWMIWNTRARFLVRAADFHTAFSPRLLFWLHQDYPWLVPGALAQVFLLGRSESLALPAALSWLFAALALAVLTLAVARLRGLYWGLLAGLALATMPCFATFAANQQSDVPLSAFLVLCVALLSLAEEERRDDLLLLSGFAAGLGAWTKNEGLLYLGCAAVALLFRQRRLRPVALFLLGAAPLLALLAGFKLGMKPPNDFVTFSTPHALLERALTPARWAELALLTLRRIVYFQDFALWVIAELLLIVIVLRKLPGSAAGTALFLSCALYAPIYVLQPHPVEWIYRTSVDRIFIQLWPAAILATILPLARATAPAPATART